MARISSTPSAFTASVRAEGSAAITATATGPPSSRAAETSSSVTGRSVPRTCSATTRTLIGRPAYESWERAEGERRSRHLLPDELLDPRRDRCRVSVEHLRALAPRRHEHAAHPRRRRAQVARLADVNVLLLGLLDRAQGCVARL